MEPDKRSPSLPEYKAVTRQKDQLVGEEGIYLGTIMECTRAVEQSIFICELFSNSIRIGNGRVGIVTEQYVNSRWTIFGQCAYGSWTLVHFW